MQTREKKSSRTPSIDRMDKEVTRSQINLPPGFRFCPTDEELMVHYLCKKAASQPFAVPVIAEVELYKYDPWDLPGKALFGDKEWYFFSQRDRKYPNGSRPNRAAASGYWKATGTDKSITSGGDRKIGVKKSLVFYKGRTPKGEKTNWIMHEYCLADSTSRAARTKGSFRMDDWVLCRVYEKLSGAQKDAMAKECRPESSWEEDVLASQPEIGDSKLLSNLPRPKFSNRMSSLKSSVPYDHGPIPRGVQISHAAVNFSDACGGGRQVNYDPPSTNSTNYHTLPTHKERCHNGSMGADPAIIVTEVGSESAYVGPGAPHLVQMGSRVERPWMSTGTVAEEVVQIRDSQMLFELQRASLGDDGVLFASWNQTGTRLKE